MTDRTLGDVIDILTIEHPVQAMFAGRPQWVRRDALITQLREAITASASGGNGTAAKAGRLPFDSDALEQYDRLVAEVPNLGRDLPEENLRAWWATVTGFADERTERDLFAMWSGWVAYIEAKLTPPIVLELIDMVSKQPFPCPDCGFGWFEKVVASGPDGKGGRWYEREKRVALVGTYRPDGRGGLERATVECGCCGWRVSGDAIRGFAWDLEALES